MAERRDQQRGQWGNPTEKATGVGAPGSTGAFQTSDPLGAPGSTGASLTNQDPTAIPTRDRAAGSDYEEPDMEYGGGGGQQQQLRHPTSGDYGGGQQLRHPTSGDYGGRQQHQLHGPTSGIGQHQQELRDPTSGVYGGGQHQQQLRDPTTGVIGSGDEFERDRAGHGPVGMTGFTKVTTTTAPGEDVIYGRETVTRAEELGSAAGAGRDEKGVVEKARELKDRVQGGAHHR